MQQQDEDFRVSTHWSAGCGWGGNLQRSGALASVSRLLLALTLVGLVSCARSQPDFDMEIPSAEELYADGEKSLQKRKFLWLIPFTDYQKAIDKFQEIVDNYPYSEYAVLAEMKIADTYYEQGKWEEALSYYRDFSELHPENQRVEYAMFRTARCYENQVQDPDRDQTATRNAVEAYGFLLDEFPGGEHTGEAEERLRNLRARLADHQFILANFYFNIEEYQAAARRYRLLLDEYPGLGFDDVVLHRLAISYTRLNRPEEAREIFNRLGEEPAP